MFQEHRPAWAEINLDNLENNIKEIRRVSKSKDIIAVIKADGYGHGALEIADTLLLNGATRIAVAILAEAVELREGGITCPIMILGYTQPQGAETLIKYDIEQMVTSYDAALELSNRAVILNKRAKLHIKLDTGMGRIGFLPNTQSVEEVYKISMLPNIELVGLFSHFSSADEKDKGYTEKQLNRFKWFNEELNKRGVFIPILHTANSAAIIDLPEAHFDAVRPGIILYGYYPSREVMLKKISLKPVMTLKANVVHVKTLNTGEAVSYGRKFITQKETVIATLPIGYADGYSRLLIGKAKVIYKGKLLPVVGRICMDQCMIDASEAPDIKVGDEVILMGEEGGVKFNADDIAEALGTINYEVTCMISKRVPRVYLKDNKVVKIRNYI